MNTKPLNIVYLHAHDAGRYVQPYGFPVETPNLMQFAKEGTLFRKAFAASPTCGPSRAALMASQYPHELGVYGLPGTKAGWAYDDYSKHLVRVLSEAGYETVLAGCQHETGGSEEELQEDLGYQRLLNKGRKLKGQFYQETIDHVECFLAEKKSQLKTSHKPFFLSVGLDEPHRNNKGREELGIGSESARFSKTRYYDPDQLDDRYVAPPPFLPDLPGIRKEMASYHEGVKIMDEYMGRVLYALKHYGLEENTLVIVTTDHGIEFPGGKMTLTDQGIGVMLMIRGPHGFEGGKVLDVLVSQLDIYPTLCEMIGLDHKPWHRGKSLLPLISGEKAKLHNAVFAEQTDHVGQFEPLRCIRTERYKLVLRHHATGPIMRQDGPSDLIVEGYGFYNRQLGHVELFDLYLDPWEHCNRAEDPAYREIRRLLEAELQQWMEETKDPFPSGKFPAKGTRA